MLRQDFSAVCNVHMPCSLILLLPVHVPEDDEADGMGDCCRAGLDPLALRLLGGCHVPPDENGDPLVPSRSCPHPWRVLRLDHSIQVRLHFWPCFNESGSQLLTTAKMLQKNFKNRLGKPGNHPLISPCNHWISFNGEHWTVNDILNFFREDLRNKGFDFNQWFWAIFCALWYYGLYSNVTWKNIHNYHNLW